MHLPELQALVELAARDQPPETPPLGAAARHVLATLGLPPPPSCRRAEVPDHIPVEAALSALRLFPSSGVDPQHVAAALSSGGLVSFDALLGLLSCIAVGETGAKLQLLYWALDKDGTTHLSLPEVLALLPAAQLAAAGARILLHQATRPSLAAEAADERWQAAAAQRWCLLEAVLRRSFAAADSRSSGVLRPGEQVAQLLYAAAGQLTSLLVGISTAAEFLPGADTASLEAPAPSEPQQASRAASRAASSLASASRAGSIAPAGAASPAPAAGSALPGVRVQLPAGSPMAQAWRGAQQHQEAGQQQQQQTGSQAEVVVLDNEGGMLHYQCSVAEAASAAVAGRAPASLPQGLHLYQRSNSGGPGGPAAGGQASQLSPAGSLVRQLELVEAQQQQQQQLRPLALQQLQREESVRLFTDSTADGLSGSGAGSQLPSKAITPGVSRRRLSQGSHAAVSPGSDAGGDKERPAPAAPPAAAVVTTTAGQVVSTMQRGIAAVSARVLLHCGICTVLICCIVLADAAMVAGLHLAAGLALPVAFGIAVAANLGLVALLVVTLVVLRCMAGETRSLREVANGPEGQQLDAVLANISAAVAALKSSEQGQGGPPVSPGGPSSSYRRVTGLSSVGATSLAARDPEAGQAAPGALGAAAGVGGPSPPGPLGRLEKLQAVWATVGRMAGFAPPGEAGAAGLESVDSLGASHAGSGPTISIAGGIAPGSAGPRPVPGMSKGARVAGSAAPAAAAAARSPSLTVREAYPQL